MNKSDWNKLTFNFGFGEAPRNFLLENFKFQSIEPMIEQNYFFQNLQNILVMDAWCRT